MTTPTRAVALFLRRAALALLLLPALGGAQDAARMDAVMEREDWVVLNTATAFIGIALPRGLELRLGAVDDLVYVPGNRYLGNAVYALIALYSDKPGGPARRLNAFAWLGGYTHHAFRTGEFTLTAGLEVTWDVMRFGAP